MQEIWKLRSTPRISEIDGEHFLGNEVNVVRDKWAEREDTVPFCSKSDDCTKNEPLRFHPLGEDPVEEGCGLSVRGWLETRTDTDDESRTDGMEQAR